MEKASFKIVTFHYPPYVFINKSKDDQWGFQGGVEYELLKSLQDKFHFRYEIVLPRIESSSESGNTWNQIVKMLRKEEADIGVASMIPTYERYQQVRFSIPYIFDPWIITTRQPDPVQNNYALIQPFKYEIWIFIFASVFLIALCFYIIRKMHSKMYSRKSCKIFEALWYTLTIAQTGGRLRDRKFSMLLLLSAWLISTAVIQWCYSGILIGFLTFPGYETEIRSFHDLIYAIRRRRFGICVSHYTDLDFILDPNSEHYIILNQVILDDPSTVVGGIKPCLRLVLQKKCAFVGSNRLSVEYEANDYGLEKFLFANVQIENQITIATSPRFPFRRQFNLAMRRLSEMGLPEKWMLNVVNKQRKGKISSEFMQLEKSTDSALALSKLYGVFLFLCIGWVLSCFVFFVELFVHHRTVGVG